MRVEVKVQFVIYIKVEVKVDRIGRRLSKRSGKIQRRSRFVENHQGTLQIHIRY